MTLHELLTAVLWGFVLWLLALIPVALVVLHG